MNKLLLILVVVLAVISAFEAFVIVSQSGRRYETEQNDNSESRLYDASPIPFQEDIEYRDDGDVESWSVGLRYGYNYLGDFRATLQKSDEQEKFNKLSLMVSKERGFIGSIFKIWMVIGIPIL